MKNLVVVFFQAISPSPIITFSCGSRWVSYCVWVRRRWVHTVRKCANLMQEAGLRQTPDTPVSVTAQGEQVKAVIWFQRNKKASCSSSCLCTQWMNISKAGRIHTCCVTILKEKLLLGLQWKTTQQRAALSVNVGHKRQLQAEVSFQPPLVGQESLPVSNEW